MNHGKQGMWPQTGNTVLFVSTSREAALRIELNFILTYFKTSQAAPYFYVRKLLTGYREFIFVNICLQKKGNVF